MSAGISLKKRIVLYSAVTVLTTMTITYLKSFHQIWFMKKRLHIL